MRYITLLFLCLLSFCTPAATIHNVVVFGDSLSDMGNLYEYMNHQLPVSPPYYKGRFTNGPVWIELLMEQVYPGLDANTHLRDYAYGGAGVALEDEDDGFFSFQTQMQTYFNEHDDKAYADSLYVIWVGANNYFNLPEQADSTINQVVAAIHQGLEQLIAKGGRHFLLLNVPDLSRTPAAIEFEAEDDLRFMSLEHNKRFSEMLEQMRAKYPDIQIMDYDVTVMMNAIIDDPQKYNFIDGEHTCYDHLDNDNPPEQIKHSLFLRTLSSKAYSTQDSCDDYLFFDLYHPTAHAHRILAEETLELLKKNHLVFE